jgi:hypothetical protein
MERIRARNMSMQERNLIDPGAAQKMCGYARRAPRPQMRHRFCSYLASIPRPRKVAQSL